MAEANKMLDDIQHDLSEACDFLRSFSLGQRGFTQADGMAGIGRVRALCKEMQTHFAAGPHATVAARAIAAGTQSMEEATKRLELLRA